MSERIFTLFGEEIFPEPQKPAGKARAKKKEEEKTGGEEQAPATDNNEVQETGNLNEKEENNREIIGQESGKKEENTGNKKTPVTEVKPEAADIETSIWDDAEPEKTGSEAEVEKKPKKQPQKRELKPAALPENWKGEDKYYTIGEVADLFKVKTSHIRFWTTEFKMKVRTTRKGDRLYNAEQVREMKAIHHLVKERGFTLTGARAKMKAQNNMDVETVDLKQSLLQLRSKLIAIKNQLR